MRVATYQVVFGLKIDPNIVFKKGHCLARIEEALGGQLVSLNTPRAAAPEAPRALVRTSDTIVSMCLNRLEILMLLADETGGDFATATDAARALMKQILLLCPVADSYEWAGMIASLQYPGSDPTLLPSQAAAPAADRLLSVGRRGRSLTAFQLQYGFQDRDLYRTYTFGGYSKGTVELQKQVSLDDVVDGAVRMDPSDVVGGRQLETGISVVIDFNNKPAGSHAGPEDGNGILDAMVSSFSSLSSDFNLEGILE